LIDNGSGHVQTQDRGGLARQAHAERGGPGVGAIGLCFIRRDGLKVLAYRFDNDRWCTGQRFAACRALLGDAFDGRVLPCSSAPEPAQVRRVSVQAQVE
jgi:RimJ/RimL family protein N-acetyltransferase